MNPIVEYYTKLLSTQYWEQPNAVAEVTLLATEWANIHEFVSQWISEFDLDHASGDRLVKIAALVGQPLTVSTGVVKKYFGFSQTTITGSFGTAPMYDSINDSKLTVTQLNDTQLRLFIRARIAKNTAAAVMVSDTRTSIQDAVQLLFSGRAYVSDNRNMVLTYYVNETVQLDELQLLINADLLPTPQGVGTRFVQYTEGATFGFANNPNAKTFGEGTFASLII